MVLLTGNFSCHVLTVFIFYKQYLLADWYTFDDGDEGVTWDVNSYVLTLIWHSYYLSISLLVIIGGALLSKQVGVTVIICPNLFLTYTYSDESMHVLSLGTKNWSICSQTYT